MADHKCGVESTYRCSLPEGHAGQHESQQFIDMGEELRSVNFAHGIVTTARNHFQDFAKASEGRNAQLRRKLKAAKARNRKLRERANGCHVVVVVNANPAATADDLMAIADATREPKKFPVAA